MSTTFASIKSCRIAWTLLAGLLAVTARAGGPDHSTISGDGARTSGADAQLKVDAGEPDDESAPKISPTLYGSNWASWCKFSAEAQAKAKALNLRVIRFGGSQISRYNWKNGKYTYPLSRRIEKAADTLDQFIAACRQVGAEPLIQVNALGWAPNPKNLGKFEKCLTEQDAADLVTYLNKTKGYGVKFFEIDNEPDIWNEIHPDIHPTESSLPEYTALYKRYAYAMKKAQAAVGSAEIKIFGPAAAKMYDLEGVRTFMRECREFEKDRAANPEGFRILDVLSFHHYPLLRTNYEDVNSFIPEGVPAMLESVQSWWNPDYLNRYEHNQPMGEARCLIPRFQKFIQESYPGTQLAVTELGVDSGPRTRYLPVVRPIYLADLLGILATHGVDFAMPGWVWHSDPVFGLAHQTEDRPSYYPLMLYSEHFNGTVLKASSSLGDLLNLYACKNERGAVVLMIVNKDDKDHLPEIRITGYHGAAVKEKFRVQSPRYSLTCVILPADPNAREADVWTYGEKQIGSPLRDTLETADGQGLSAGTGGSTSGASKPNSGERTE
jgi:glycosyl hydrolase family 44